MKASILPCEVASKQSNGFMIWPPGKTFASRCAAPWSTSSAGVQVVDIRH